MHVFQSIDAQRAQVTVEFSGGAAAYEGKAIVSNGWVHFWQNPLTDEDDVPRPVSYPERRIRLITWLDRAVVVA